MSVARISGGSRRHSSILYMCLMVAQSRRLIHDNVRDPCAPGILEKKFLRISWTFIGLHYKCTVLTFIQIGSWRSFICHEVGHARATNLSAESLINIPYLFKETLDGGYLLNKNLKSFPKCTRIQTTIDIFKTISDRTYPLPSMRLSAEPTGSLLSDMRS